MAMSICLSVRLSCLADKRRGICLSFSTGGLMRWGCPFVCLSVRPSVRLPVAKMRTLKCDFLKN